MYLSVSGPANLSVRPRYSCLRTVYTYTHPKDQWERASLTHTNAHALSFLFTLISDLLGSDLWHLHTSDPGGGGGLVGKHTRSRTQTRSNAERTDGERADSKRSTPRCSRASAAAGVTWGRGGQEKERGGRRSGRWRRNERAEGDKSSSGIYPRRSLKSMQPKENQSALLSYAVPFWRTSGAM